MSIKIVNEPAADVLMNSMRSIGYSFQTALSDIIDNSIAACAKNIFINIPIGENKTCLTIFDDGIGMTDEELLNAMKYGTIKEKYESNDLGRFGLGLKVASLSQCRCLTVLSKKEGKLCGYKWDLDEVLNAQSWICLKLNDIEMDSVINKDKFDNASHGTLVVWEKFDVLQMKIDKLVHEALIDELDKAKKHICLVFHRFMNRKNNPIRFYMNNNLLIGLEPFLEDHIKTDRSKKSELLVGDSKIFVQAYILPHQNDLTDEDIKKLGGIDKLKNDQGFYIYRNDRLINYGTWFGLPNVRLKSELYKYGRIKVDIPNTLDAEWGIDVKKQDAAIPRIILNQLKGIVGDVSTKSSSKTIKRTRISFNEDDTKIWNKRKTRENKDYFYINVDSQYVRYILDSFNDRQKKKIISLLETISDKLPSDDIYSSVSQKNICIDKDEEKIGNDVEDGFNYYLYVKHHLQLDEEHCLEMVKSIEPFNDEIIFQKIKERVNNGK